MKSIAMVGLSLNRRGEMVNLSRCPIVISVATLRAEAVAKVGMV